MNRERAGDGIAILQIDEKHLGVRCGRGRDGKAGRSDEKNGGKTQKSEFAQNAAPLLAELTYGRRAAPGSAERMARCRHAPSPSIAHVGGNTSMR
jgi:hypothetical protein